MAIKWAGAAHKTHLETASPGTRDDRLYLDFRRQDYPSYTGSPTFTLIDSSDNQPGSHNMTGGYATFLTTLPSSVTIHARVYPQFAYDTADTQWLWLWQYTTSIYLRCFYSATADKIYIGYMNGGTARYLISAQFDDGSSYTDINQWLDITFTGDLTTGDTSGSALYINGTSVDTTWSGNIDAFSDVNINTLYLRYSSTCDYHVNHFRIFPNYVATPTQVANRFKDVTAEEIYFPLNGCAIGHTRCNISRASYTDSNVSFVKRISTRRGVETKTGESSANTLDVELNNAHGEFSTDQYAAFDPTQDQFNGTSSQAYLRNLCGVELESWYGTTYDPVFVGKIAEGGFSRTTPSDKYSSVRFTAEDGWGEIAREVKRRGRAYEDKKLSDGTEADSLVHLIARLATQKEVYNYLSNSSFENATIGNSWSAFDATLTRSSTNALIGTYSASIEFSTDGHIRQIITFTDTTKLSVGQTYNLSVYALCADAFSGSLKLAENDSGGENDSTSATITLAGGEGFKRFNVSHTITDSDSDRMRIFILADSGTAFFDCAMLVSGSEPVNYWVLNNNDGASGSESADDADYSSYDTIGFDVDAVDITHPWAIVEEGVSIGDHLGEIAQAVAARYMGLDSCGTLKMRSPLKTSYSDPTPIETVDDAMSVQASVDYATANKIIGHGVKILKASSAKSRSYQLLWSAEDSGAFESDYANYWGIDVADDGVFPDPTEYGDFWAQLEALGMAMQSRIQP